MHDNNADQLGSTMPGWQQAFGLLTTLAPDLEIDIRDPLGMARAIERHVMAERAALEERDWQRQNDPREVVSTLDDYQRAAMATRNDGTDLIYASGKLTIEAAELQQHVLKMAYHDKPLSLDDVEDELGDVLWYVAAVADYLGMSLAQVAESNLVKLRARHGASYNPAHYTEAG